MFMGHYSAALVAKAVEPRAPLWSYVAAAQLLVIGFSVLVMSGVEKARLDGLVVTWPSRSEGLRLISISETGRAKLTVGITAEVPPEVAVRAGAAAQKAADRVIEKASDKA